MEFVKLTLEPFNLSLLNGSPNVTKLEVFTAPFRFTGRISSMPFETESVLFTILFDVVLKLILAARNLNVRTSKELYVALTLWLNSCLRSGLPIRHCTGLD